MQKFAQYINTDMGRAAVSGFLAVGLEFIPLPAAMKEALDPIKESVVEELGTMALDEGTQPLEMMAAFLLPALQSSLMPLLSSPEVKKLSA